MHNRRQEGKDLFSGSNDSLMRQIEEMLDAYLKRILSSDS
jgi:hypothetical protein